MDIYIKPFPHYKTSFGRRSHGGLISTCGAKQSVIDFKRNSSVFNTNIYLANSKYTQIQVLFQKIW